MKAKTLFVIILTVLTTVVLMKNSEEVDFWFFGIVKLPKLAMMGIMLALGFVAGLLVARPRRKNIQIRDHSIAGETQEQPDPNGLSDEDREYIS